MLCSNVILCYPGITCYYILRIIPREPPHPDVTEVFSCVFQIQKLESDIMPLKQANSELSEKSGMLQAEKKIMEEEIKRWKARTQVSEKTRKDNKNFLCWFITNILLGWCFIISHHKQTTYSVLLAFGEPAERLRSRGVQASALREGGTPQTHSAAQWGEHQTQSRGCQVRDYEWSIKQHIKSVHFPFSPTGSLPL